MNSIAKPSIQSLFIKMKYDGQCISSGTGFLVCANDSIYLITNRHNATGRNQFTNKPLSKTGGIPNEVSILHNAKGKLGSWLWKTEPLYDGDTPLWHEHPLGGAEFDLVALRLSDTAGIDHYPYEPKSPNPSISVGPSDIVSVVGFPFGISSGGALAIWASGFVASEPSIQSEPTFLIDCRSRPGQSGSAVIAYRSGGAVSMEDGSTGIFSGPVARLLGIYSGRINAESDLGIVWKTSVINELVNSIAL